MPPGAETVWHWEFDPWVLALILLPGVLYVCGWRQVHRQRPHRFGAARLAAFLAGLAALVLAIASPLHAYADLLLTAHMLQHLLLMLIVPPLLLAGAPYLPLLRGLPRRVVKHGLGPFLAWPALWRWGRRLTHPLTAWLAFVVTSTAWHVPVLYELALHAPGWHAVEHLCFVATALLFWWPVLQPWPSRPQGPRWVLLPYLFLADVQNTILAALLTFCERVLYPTYATAPRLTAMTALDDQAAAGAIMWVLGSVAFLIPAGCITIQVLQAPRAAVRPVSGGPGTSTAAAERQRRRRADRGASWDLLSIPLIGAVVRWPYSRRVAQTAMFLLAVAVIADGVLGHQMGAMNLAGVLLWTYWRGLVVVALLAVGNVFCMACPFMLARDLGRRLLPARWRWPKRLRSKWLAVGLLATYLWAYEAFSLWDSPWWTAWVVIGYFVTALVIDGLFQGASFCKYVCPICQFNFVQSLISPLEVQVRDLDVCRTCTTYDCIRGNDAQRGCELALFQPKKSGNLDCTFCLDCVHACPHQNVGVIAVTPGLGLTHDTYRSSLGRLSRRPDVATLVLVLVFGAPVNAAGMVSPVVAWEQAWQGWIACGSLLPVITGVLVLGVLIAPALLAALCGVISQALGGPRGRWQELTCSFVTALVPLGCSMWVAHLVYHLMTGALTVVPVAQRAAADLGIGWLGTPHWALSSTPISLDWLPSLQILLLDGGLLLTLYVSWRMALRFTSHAASAMGVLAPWGGLALALYAAGVWIVLQPMQMRGMMHAMMP